ncbi:hypothetical protein [Uliginosibacterium sp. H1]|uniref:hypothetical protein n=1 Tax=Uliginosibacterium sp. H1 TaxID=3114757 RepID=UPI002E191EB3|nr:hypothetical protein [Uliginosibacterium sp. H1]
MPATCRLASCLCLSLLSLGALAEPTTVAELRAAGATALNSEQVRQLLPKTEVVSMADTGMERHWTNLEDGSFVARASNPRLPKAPVQNGAGTWRIDDRGAYCVNIDWFTRKEAWCQFVFSLGDRHYFGASQVNPEARVAAIQLKR